MLPTSIRRPCVVLAASECCSVQSTTALLPRDEALHHEKTDPPRQRPAPASIGDQPRPAFSIAELQCPVFKPVRPSS